MPDPHEVLLVIQQWVQKAENDLQTATYTLQLGEDCPTDTVCFHAQQCIEKYIKALLVLHESEFPRTHNLGVLIARLPRQTRPPDPRRTRAIDGVCDDDSLSRGL